MDMDSYAVIVAPNPDDPTDVLVSTYTGDDAEERALADAQATVEGWLEDTDHPTDLFLEGIYHHDDGSWLAIAPANVDPDRRMTL